MALTGKANETGAGSFIDNATPTVMVTATGVCRIQKLLIINTDTVNDVTLELYKVPSGGSISGDDYKIGKGLIIPPSDGNGGNEDIREVAGLLLTAGDSIRALAGTASKLKFDVSYFEES